MAIVKRVGAAIAGVLIIGGGMLTTMRLGWWSPSYAAVRTQFGGLPSKFVMVGDVKLNVRDEGAGPVVILLHSSMTDLREWDDWARQLKPHYRVVRIDWPPYGLTVDPAPSRGMSGVVDLLDRFVTTQHLGRFTLIGSSSGATICVLYTAAHPEKVAALALSTLPLAAPPPTRFSMAQRSIQWLHERFVTNYYPRFYYRMALAALYGVPARLTSRTVTWYYDTNNIPGRFAQVRTYLAANRAAVWSHGAAGAARSIRVPILLQWGDRDPVLPAALAATAQNEFSLAPVTLIHYPDIGHYPMLEQPEQTGRDLLTFLDRVTATSTISRVSGP